MLVYSDDVSGKCVGERAVGEGRSGPYAIDCVGAKESRKQRWLPCF